MDYEELVSRKCKTDFTVGQLLLLMVLLDELMQAKRDLSGLAGGAKLAIQLFLANTLNTKEVDYLISKLVSNDRSADADEWPDIIPTD